MINSINIKNHPKHPQPTIEGFRGAYHLITLNFPCSNEDF